MNQAGHPWQITPEALERNLNVLTQMLDVLGHLLETAAGKSRRNLKSTAHIREKVAGYARTLRSYREDSPGAVTVVKTMMGALTIAKEAVVTLYPDKLNGGVSRGATSFANTWVREKFHRHSQAHLVSRTVIKSLDEKIDEFQDAFRLLLTAPEESDRREPDERIVAPSPSVPA